MLAPHHTPLVARSLAAAQAQRLGPVVHAATGGDPLAWAELFRRFTRRIGAVAHAHRLGFHEAEDIVQDTWLRALEQARRALECQPQDPTAFDVLDTNERACALTRALDHVTERERALLNVLLSEPEPSYAEISAALGMPIGSIGPTRGRAIARLRSDHDLAAAILD